ncbi:hypothetical protein EKD04_016560 [Chloroflexales bacterium ZM16-3]|nr:hypothetical protein [Chloroflexales bacterium ZM16-3]
MDILINERSFVGQARYYNARNAMRAMADTIEALKPTCCGGQVLIHSSLVHRPFIEAQALSLWLRSEDHTREDAPIEDLPTQALIGIILDAFSRGPYIDELLADIAHLCAYAEEQDLEGSALAGAICLQGLLVSLDGCAAFPDGELKVHFCQGDDPIKPHEVKHFTSPRSARRTRRRYVPHKKHHPARAKPPASPMPLDLAYDPIDDTKRAWLRNPENPAPDTEAQRLLDCAEPGEKQFYARTYDRRRRIETFYEFQPDAAGGYHGYPVPMSEVLTAEVVRRLRERE